MADRLDLRDLRYFEAIADAGHVGRAARTLHRSQPTLTGAIRRLEDRLGTPLFERAGRGIRLTAAGAALHSRARALRIAADDAVREVAEVGRGLSGLVRIGMVPTAARFLMPPLSREFLREAPQVTFRVVIANNDVLRTALDGGELDVTVNFTPPTDEGVVSYPVFRDECVVVAARNHPLFRRKATLRDLARHGWVLANPTVATRQWLERTFHERGLPPPRVHIETNHVLSLPTLIEENALLSFLSRRHLVPGGPLRELRRPETTMRREFALCYRRHSYLSPAAHRVVEMLRTRGEMLFGRR